jgi:hypothetical protein
VAVVVNGWRVVICVPSVWRGGREVRGWGRADARRRFPLFFFSSLPLFPISVYLTYSRRCVCICDQLPHQSSSSCSTARLENPAGDARHSLICRTSYYCTLLGDTRRVLAPAEAKQESHRHGW